MSFLKLIPVLGIASLGVMASCSNPKSQIAKKWQIAGTEVQIAKQDSAMHAQLKQMDTMSLATYNAMSKQSFTQTQYDSLKTVIKNGVEQQIAQMKDQAANSIIEFKENGVVANILHGKVVDSSSKWSVKDKVFTITAPSMQQGAQPGAAPGAAPQTQQIKFNIVKISSDSFIIKSNQPNANEPIKFQAYKGK